jgi:trk system potassium uptake protein
MRISVVLRVFSIFLLILSAFMVTPLLFAWRHQEPETVTAFLYPVALNLGIFALISITCRNREHRPLSLRGGFLFVTLAWFGASASGALPLFLSGAIPSYTDAFFESISGFTTTGASILTEIQGLPKSIHFWRSLTHWLGGMGIVVLTVAILPLLGSGGFQLVKAESPGPSLDKVTPRITSTAKILWLLYLGLSAAETVLLLFGGMSLFDALTHTFGTMATGGFSPMNASVGHYPSAFVHIVITVFMLMAGVNFVLYHKLLMGNIREIGRNSEVKAYIGIFIVSMLIVAVSLYRSGEYRTFAVSLRYAGFQTASILTTTGFATADFDAWPHVAKIVLFLLMFVGGSAGSTGGGIKVGRIVALFKLGVNELKYLIHPRGVFNIRINGLPAKKDFIYVISAFFFLYLLMLVVTTLVVATAGCDIVTSFSAALVTLGNIGPGFGKIGPTMNFEFFPAYVKWFLSFIMAVGRLEIYTVLVLLTPRFWRR